MVIRKYHNMEATLKIVNGMVKERLLAAVELAGLLDEAHHDGFQAPHDTYSGAISVVALYKQDRQLIYFYLMLGA